MKERDTNFTYRTRNEKLGLLSFICIIMRIHVTVNQVLMNVWRRHICLSFCVLRYCGGGEVKCRNFYWRLCYNEVTVKKLKLTADSCPLVAVMFT